MKDVLFSLFKWAIVRPWPVLIPIVCLFGPFVAGAAFPRRRRPILIASGTLMTLAGIGMALFLLNENMVTLQGRSLFAPIEQWRAEFPLTTRSAEVKPMGLEARATASNIEVSTTRPSPTTDERLAELEKQVREIRQDAGDRQVAVTEEMSRASARVSGLATALQDTVIGDFRLPLFAALISMAGLLVLSWEALWPSRVTPSSGERSSSNQRTTNKKNA